MNKAIVVALVLVFVLFVLVGLASADTGAFCNPYISRCGHELIRAAEELRDLLAQAYRLFYVR